VTLHPYNKFGFGWSFDDHELFSLEIANNHPTSRGRVGLSSADPLAPAAVTHPYLRDDADIKPLAWALEEMRRIMYYPPLADHGLKELLPGPVVETAPDLEDYIRCGSTLFRKETGECDMKQLPANHLAGTCKMGDETDPTSVVDRKLRVIGVHGLRVADASVMPTLPSGNTHATCMMIGERAAQFVLDDLAAARSSK